MSKKYTGPRVKDTESFIQKARWEHGDKYGYERVNYRGYKERVEIVCNEHGSFWQMPRRHVFGRGCAGCGGSERGTTKTFISKARNVHGGLYDYSRVEYRNYAHKVEILCEDHGIFLQTPKAHLDGQGCLECFKDKRKKGLCWKPTSAIGLKGFYGTDAPSNLYILLLNNSFIKVGLAKEIHTRTTQINRESGYSVEKLYSIPGVANELFDLEQDILRNSNLKQYYPEQSFKGDSECLELSELPKVISIIEVSFLHTNTNKKHEDIAA